MNLGQAWNPALRRIDPEKVERGDVAPACHVYAAPRLRVHVQRFGPGQGRPGKDPQGTSRWVW